VLLGRITVRPFTDAQIELAETFADQAVIANRERAALRRGAGGARAISRSRSRSFRALGEVSQAVSSTLKLETVLETIVGCAVQLSGSDSGIVYEFDELCADLPRRGGSYRITAEPLGDSGGRNRFGLARARSVRLVRSGRSPGQLGSCNKAGGSLRDVQLFGRSSLDPKRLSGTSMATVMLSVNLSR